MWRLQIRHHTGYRYHGNVQTTYNEVRMSPMQTPRQTALSHNLEISPVGSLYSYSDYWGTRVTAFDIHEPHSELSVIGDSLVETERGIDLSTQVGCSWDGLSEENRKDQFCEFSSPSRFTPASHDIAAQAAEFRSETSPVRAAVRVDEWIRDTITYDPGATTVLTNAEETFFSRRGVCQDFAHLGIAIFRAMGIPARYVSGYFFPKPDGQVGETVAGESHAWLEAWLGQWVPMDVTNGSSVGERHVAVAYGRDYGDVPPVKGIYHGAPSDPVGVEVSITRLA